MRHIDRLTVKFREQAVGTLSLMPDNRLCVFQYDKSWINDGFSISPFDLPLKSGTFVAKPHPFYGNFGIFEDSLPDGYGRYLLHKSLLKKGINDTDLSSLDRLAIVGNNGMGALTYAPTINLESEDTLTDFDRLQEIALDVLGEKQERDAGLLLYNSGNSGGARPKVVYTDSEGHWLIKFRHTYDPADIGIQEYRYNLIARECGIIVPDFRLINGKYFASRRFDIDNDNNRLHTATASALLGISLNEPFMDYANLMALTGFLTRNLSDVEQMYRRMIFNYIVDNKDDHCKNFSFYVIADPKSREWHWRLAPAYDLTCCPEGYNGQHATSVNNTGQPRISDFIKVGTKIRLPEKRCHEIIAELRLACKDISGYDILS